MQNYKKIKIQKILNIFYNLNRNKIINWVSTPCLLNFISVVMFSSLLRLSRAQLLIFWIYFKSLPGNQFNENFSSVSDTLYLISFFWEEFFIKLFHLSLILRWLFLRPRWRFLFTKKNVIENGHRDIDKYFIFSCNIFLIYSMKHELTNYFHLSHQ